MRKVKVLFFAADPSRSRPGGIPLELAEELREILRHVKQATYGHRLLFEAHGAARADDLMDLLERTDAQVVHFSGHGGQRGLVVVGRDGCSPHPVDAAALRRMFRTYEGSVRLVVLSACSSDEEARAIADVVGCAIGTPSKISDVAAITFNSRFYRAIANGRSVRRAFDEACMALQVYRVPRSEYPEIFVREGVDPGSLFLVKRHRLVPRRVALAATATVLTAAIVLHEPPVAPEPTASDIACGSESPASARIQPLAGSGAAAATPSNPPGVAGDLADAKALYRARKYKAAAAAFAQAEAAGNAEAGGCLGIMHLYARGMPRDTATGRQLLHKAIDKDRDPHAMYALGMAYLAGMGPAQRMSLAEHWLRESAELGFADALRTLGNLAQQAQSDSSYRMARSLYRQAVDAGSADALVDLGLTYEQGLGVPVDTAAALALYDSAADRESLRGMVAMGRAYQEGIGVPRDYEKAMDLYHAAARAGSADAMNRIGVLHENGWGVRRSRARAKRWYARAAEAGSQLGSGNLGALASD
jgi:TPR repeat protein